MIFKNFPIWQLITKPRRTARELLDKRRYPAVLPPLLILTFAYTISGVRAAQPTGLLDIVVEIIKNFSMGLIGGYLSVLIGTEIFTHIGRWIGGRGNREEVRAVWIWSLAPTLIIILPLLIMLLSLDLFDFPNIPVREVFTSNLLLAVLVALFILVLLFDRIYEPILFLLLLAEAHRFSFLKALLLQVISIIALAAVVALLVLIMLVFNF